MTVYELIKRVYWLLDEWIASSLGLGDYYGADDVSDNNDDVSEKNEENEVADKDNEDDEDLADEVSGEDDGCDDTSKYHDHQA